MDSRQFVPSLASPTIQRQASQQTNTHPSRNGKQMNLYLFCFWLGFFGFLAMRKIANIQV